MNSAAKTLIAALDLEPHPEGGWYRETYRSELTVEVNGQARSAGTAILYLLTESTVSRFHRIDADEIWHFHQGDPLTIYTLLPNGVIREDILSIETPQVMIKAGLWFGAKLTNDEGYCLTGCTVSPAFEFSGFELADRKKLLAEWPNAKALIERLT